MVLFVNILFCLSLFIISSEGESNNSYDVIVVGLGAAGTMAASTLARAGKRVLALEAQDRIGGRVHTVPFADNLVEVGAECNNSYDVIVVGLGAAGTMAASTLARAGKRVLALEAQDRIGGRVHTVPFADNLVEVGAEWIHGQTPSLVYDLALNNSVDVLSQNWKGMNVYHSDGTPLDNKLFYDLIDFSETLVDKELDENKPMGKYITDKLIEELNKTKPEVLKTKFFSEFLVFLNNFYNGYEATSDWNDATTSSTYQALEGDSGLSWHKHGYKTFFDIMLNTFKNGSGLPKLNIKLKTEVTQISWPTNDDGVVKVKTANGDVFEAKHVIVTVSVGVLKEKHTKLFSPPLPSSKVEAINDIPMGVLDKIIFSFTEPWWTEDSNAFMFVWTEEDINSLPSDDKWLTKSYGASKPMASNNAFTVWFAGDTARMIETLPDSVVKTKTMWLLRKFMGGTYNITEPTAMLRSYWNTNPFTRGSYTYDNLVLGAKKTTRQTLAMPLPNEKFPSLLISGEATHETHFSTVHGAAASGKRAACKLIPCVGGTEY